MKSGTKSVIHFLLLAGFCLTLFGDPVHLSNKNHHECQICSVCLLNENSQNSLPCQHGDNSDQCEKCRNNFSIRGHKIDDRDANEMQFFTVDNKEIDAVEPEEQLEPESVDGIPSDLIPPLITTFLNAPSGLRAPPLFV